MAEEKEERTELAQDRTEWADQRTFLAQERTFAGWMRTALTAIAVGLGIIELLRELDPQWLVSAVGITFLIIGGLVQIVALISYENVNMDMRASDKPSMSISSWWIGPISVATILCAVSGVVLALY